MRNEREVISDQLLSKDNVEVGSLILLLGKLSFLTAWTQQRMETLQHLNKIKVVLHLKYPLLQNLG